MTITYDKFEKIEIYDIYINNNLYFVIYIDYIFD